jgi:hypothetical protein
MRLQPIDGVNCSDLYDYERPVKHTDIRCIKMLKLFNAPACGAVQHSVRITAFVLGSRIRLSSEWSLIFPILSALLTRSLVPWLLVSSAYPALGSQNVTL